MVIGLQHKSAFTIQRDAMSYRAAFELADASRAERRFGAVASRQACKYDILHGRLQWRGQTYNVGITVGQEGDGKPANLAVGHERFVACLTELDLLPPEN